MIDGKPSILIRSVAGRAGSILLGILNVIAESDRRYQEEMRLRGVSENFLKDVGLTRRRLDTAYSRETPFRLNLGSRTSVTPAE